MQLKARTLAGASTGMAELRGRPVLIDVWATWCSACRTNLIAANELAGSKTAPELVVVGLSVDHDPDEARRWLEEALPERNLQGWQANPSATFTALNIRALPATVLLDAEGRILAKHEGTDAEELSTLLAHARSCGKHPG